MDCRAGDVGGGSHARGLRRQTRSRFRARPRSPPSPAGVSHMLNLKEYRSGADRLDDNLPWAALIATGVVLNQDASFQRTLRFLGPALERAQRDPLDPPCGTGN